MTVRKAETVYLGDASSVVKAAQTAQKANEAYAAKAKASAAEIVAAQDRVRLAGDKAARSAIKAGESKAKAASVAGRASLEEAKAQELSTSRQVAAYRKASEAAVAAADKQAVAHKKAIDSVVSVGKWTTVALAGGVYAAAKWGMAFQSAGTQVQGAAGISEAAAKRITAAFANTSGQFEQSGQKLEQAFAGVAGQLKLTEGRALSEADAVKVMRAASELAIGTQTDLNDATGALAKTMQAYHFSVGQAKQASDVLFNTSKALNAPIDQIATGIGRLHARLGEVAPALSDTAGLMISLGEHGLTGSRGVLIANTALQTLIGGSKKSTEVLHALGIELFDKQGKFVGLRSVIEQLQPKLAGLTQQEKFFAEKALFGAGAAQVMGQVVQAGVPKFNQATAAATRMGAAHKAAEAHAHTLGGQFDTLKATVETLGGKIGLALIPKLEGLTKDLAAGVQWLGKHKTAATALAVVIGTVLSVAVGAFVVNKMAALIKSVRLAATALGLMGRSAAVAAPEVTALGVAADGEAVALDGATTATEGMTVATAGLGASFVAALAKLTPLIAAFAAYKAFTSGSGLSVPGGESIDPNATTAQQQQQFQRWLHIHDRSSIGQADFGKNAHISGLSAQQNFVANQGMKMLTGAGLSGSGAAALLGNFQQESSLNPAAHGGGLAQWIGGRGSALWAFDRSHNLNAMTSQGQFAFAIHELQTQYPGLWKQLQQGGNPASLALAVSQQYERPGIPNNPAREHYASQILSAFGGNGGGGGGSFGDGGGGSAAINALMNPAKKAKKISLKSIRQLLYANPLPGMTSVGRTDQGVDFSATPGSAVNAIGAGVVDSIIANWYKGQPLIEEKLTSGPNKGKFVYYAEQLKSLVHIGQQVKAGQRIGTVASSGTGLELGFGAGHGRTLAQATTGYTEGQQTPAGKAFLSFVRSIGSKGTYETIRGGTVTGGGQGSGFTLAQLEQSYTSALVKSGKTMLGQFTGASTVPTLEKMLGISAGVIHGSVSTSGLARLSGKSAAGKGFTATIAQLVSDGQKKLANQLVAAHKAALVRLDHGIIELQQKQLKAFNDAITALKKQTTDLAKQAAQAWRSIQEGVISAAHDAAIRAIGSGPIAQQLAAMQAADRVTQNAQQLASLNQAITDAQTLVDHSGGQTHLDALKQLKDAQQALTDYERQQDEQRLQDQIDAATRAADDTQQAALDGLDQQTTDYQNGLDAQFNILTDQLNKRRLTYAQWAADVNAILDQYGLSVATDSSTAATVNAGSGAAASPGVGGLINLNGQEYLVSYNSAGQVHFTYEGSTPRASGGPVEPGYVYRVGEQGPEDVVFGHSGTVMTAAQTRRRGGSGGNMIIDKAYFTGSQSARAAVDRLAFRAGIGTQ